MHIPIHNNNNSKVEQQSMARIPCTTVTFTQNLSQLEDTILDVVAQIMNHFGEFIRPII